MFEEMVSLLKQGKIIDLNLLKKRFDRALVKKIGVINTPYPFWTTDPKINPRTKELLWAAILLEDNENFRLLVNIAATEADEKKRASGDSAGITHSDENSRLIGDESVKELLEMAPTDGFRIVLQQKIDNTRS
jgi:hypothetical protein